MSKKQSKKEVYPITEGLRRKLAGTNATGQPASGGGLTGDVLMPQSKYMLEFLGEYEDGTVDVEGMFDPVFEKYGLKFTSDLNDRNRKMMVELYATVVEDVILGLEAIKAHPHLQDDAE